MRVEDLIEGIATVLANDPDTAVVTILVDRGDAETVVVAGDEARSREAELKKEVHDLRNDLASARAEVEILRIVMEVEPGKDDEEVKAEAELWRHEFVAARGTPHGARCARMASWLEELRRKRLSLTRSEHRVRELDLAVFAVLKWNGRHLAWLRQWLPGHMYEGLRQAVSRCLDAAGGDLLKESVVADAPPDGSLRQVAKRLGLPTCSRCGEPARELSAGLCVDCAPDDGWPSSGSKSKEKQ